MFEGPKKICQLLSIVGSKIESIERLNHCVWHLCSVATPEWLRGSPLSRPTPEPEPVQCEHNQRPCHSSADCGLYTQKADVSLIRTFYLLTFSKTVGRPLICNSVVRKTLFKEFLPLWLHQYTTFSEHERREVAS